MSTLKQLKTSLFLVALSVAINAPAALTDISNSPLITGVSTTVQPNIFLMMDDSGSMAWDYMPDNSNSPYFGTGTYGYASNQCNGVFYDPTFTYAPPVTSTGTSYANSSFTAAPVDGFGASTTTTIDLSAHFSLGQYTDTSPTTSGGGAAYYYKYTGAQNTEALRNFYNSSGTFFKECNSNVGSTPGSGVFTKVTVGAASGPGGTDERTNFANWYSYYRTRVLMMKSSAGLAFKPISTSFRVGFATMNNNKGTDFVNLATFDATQKSAWYSKLYGVSTGNSTPLLGALSDVGRMYAYKLPSNKLNTVTANDPMQYSCQQNYAILSTDGFWNSQSGNSNLAGNTIGQQDGSDIRPMYDGATQTTTTTTTTLTVSQTQSVQNTTTTTPWTRTLTTIGAACSIPAVTPSHTTSAYVSDNSHKMALGLSASNPDSTSSHCYPLGGSGASTAWFCRGSGNSNPLVSSSSVTDSTGTIWTLVSSMSGNTGCVTNNTAFGSGYSNSYGACPGAAAVSGHTVSVQNQTYSQVASGTATTVNNNTTTTSSTVQTINGQAQPPTITTVGPVASQVSSNTAAVSDTGAPGGGTSWNNSGSAASSCMATSPTAGGSTSAAGTSLIANNGGAVVTTLSGPTTTTPATYNGNPNPLTTLASSGGTSNTLADVAEYYYLTDLRTSALGNNLSSATGFVGTDVSTNNVPKGGQDSASWQHMTTFTLGLGARGKMVFSPTYQTETSGDFFSVKNGVLANTTGGICSWQANGTVCNWPIPNVSGIPENIDDLWHAAVDGRGTYFSATNPGMLALGLSSALANVSARTGGSAAATTSNPNVTSGDNFVFSSSFATVNWTGQLIRQQLDLTTGQVSSSIDWCADDTSVAAGTSTQACPTPNNLLDTQAAASPAGGSRNIYIYNSTATNGLMSFTYANMSGAQQAFFDQSAIASLSQFCTGAPSCLSATAQSNAAGTNLVNFLRGDRSNEGILTDNTKYYRQRPLILGDIVNAEAVYMKAPLHAYADPGYLAYVASLSARQGMVYAAANDGMLHAFYAATDLMDSSGNVVSSGGASVTGGAEAWAYIPSMVLPSLYHLADKNYSNNHQYYVDGTPIAGDICTSHCSNATTAVWKTILVGGLNAGGRGYYALDISNPAQPKALWEFTDNNMGLTFGNPQIAKVCDDATCATKTWVVLVTSGYNNVSPGDGVGRLYVINAATGALIRAISTGVGNTTTPSGLSRIIAQTVNSGSDQTVVQIYGGDLLGNLWRFDVNNNVGATGYDAQLLVTLHDAAGNIQPITEKPQVGIYNGNTLVYVGTGRYLGASDLVTTGTQTIYGIKDPLTLGTTPATAIYATNPHASGSGFVQQVQTTTTCPANSPSSICLPGEIVRTSTSNLVNFALSYGWYVDLPDSGERSYTDPTLQLGTLGFTANVPSVSACTVGGYSYSYFFDYRSGAPVSTSVTHVLSVKLGNALATRPVYVMLPNNSVVQLVRMSDGSTTTGSVPIGSASVGTRRVSRRELITE